jgi:CTD small phosphatase-like protein 2
MDMLKKSLNGEVNPSVAKSYADHFEQSLQSLSFMKKLQPINEDCLLDRKIYLPPNRDHKKTLILDLDETLVHCNENSDLPCDQTIQIKFTSQEIIEVIFRKPPPPKNL